jgi:cellulose biosynthesis protein BcsQ
MYNNKGGVSKTTTLFNLGVYLSQQGYNILLADCDPQCNLTELFFASHPDMDDPDFELPGTSIYEALLPRFRGEAGAVNPSTISINTSPIYPNLHLLKGDLNFSAAETYLGTAWNQAVTENIHEKNTYVALYKLLKGLGGHNNVDYILCDVGPSTGAITRTAVLACDGIFIPLTLDRFCNQAVRLLGNIVHDWIKRHKTILTTLEPYNIEGFPGNPLFLGAILQNFKTHSATKTKESYLKWQSKISGNIQEYLIGENGMECDSELISDPYKATIRDLGPLVPISQIFGHAIFDINQSHTKEASTTGQMYYGTVWQHWVDRMEEFKDEIARIANSLP